MKKSALKLAAVFTLTAAMGLGLSGCPKANDVLFGDNMHQPNIQKITSGIQVAQAEQYNDDCALAEAIDDDRKSTSSTHPDCTTPDTKIFPHPR